MSPDRRPYIANLVVRRLGVCLLVASLAGPVLLGASPATAKEKAQDTKDVVPDKVLTMDLTGTLNATSATYDRVYGEHVDLACGAQLQDSVNDGMSFEMFCIEVSDSQPIELIVDPAGTNVADTVLTLYCDPFDPVAPLENAIAFDDDDGLGTLSAFTVADNLTLISGSEYWVVLSVYGAGMYGDFTIRTSDNVFTCGSVPLDKLNWGTFKGLYR